MALVDSVFSGSAFTDRSLTENLNIEVKKLSIGRPLKLADGKRADTIQEYSEIPIVIGNYQETWWFYVTKLSKETPLILGMPWLRQHNLHIN